MNGSSVRTGASRYGKLICDCRKNGIFKRHCARKYSGPDSSWGWDSYREEYYYSRTLYSFTAADISYDLPVYLNLFKAYRHDSLAFVHAFFDFLKLNPEFKRANVFLILLMMPTLFTSCYIIMISLLLLTLILATKVIAHVKALFLLLKRVSPFIALATLWLTMVSVKIASAILELSCKFLNKYPENILRVFVITNLLV